MKITLQYYEFYDARISSRNTLDVVMYIMPTVYDFAVVPCNYSTTFTKQK